MTGLSLEKDALIEVAALVTDGDLNILGDGVDVVIKPDPEALEQMDDFVRNMHTVSGLLDDLDQGITMAEAQQLVLKYVKQWVPEPRKAVLGGNSVGTDKTFLVRDMPELVDYLHYRVIDVSTIKELSRRWFEKATLRRKPEITGHWAISRIPLTSCVTTAERSLFPPPGPIAQPPRRLPRRLRQPASRLILLRGSGGADAVRCLAASPRPPAQKFVSTVTPYNLIFDLQGIKTVCKLVSVAKTSR